MRLLCYVHGLDDTVSLTLETCFVIVANRRSYGTVYCYERGLTLGRGDSHADLVVYANPACQAGDLPLPHTWTTLIPGY